MAAWLDPLVAMLMSVWLIYAWGGQAYYNVMNLVGLSAQPPFLQKLTYLCWNHDPRILQIDTVRCKQPTSLSTHLLNARAEQFAVCHRSARDGCIECLQRFMCIVLVFISSRLA